MAKDFRFKLNLPGLNRLMKGAEMQTVLNRAAGEIAARAGDGYETETAHPISFIGIASVRAESREAKKDNSENNSLLKAAGSVRL